MNDTLKLPYLHIVGDNLIKIIREIVINELDHYFVRTKCRLSCI